MTGAGNHGGHAGVSRLVHPGRVTVAIVALGLAAVTLLAWFLRPSPPAVPGAERVRQYSNVRVCMLTGAGGVTGPVAAAAWAGMQGASSASAAMVSYLPVPALASKATAPSTATALSYLTSLVARQCSVIVAVGQAQVAAALSEAARYRHVHFIVITQGPARQASLSAPAVVRIASAPAAQVLQAVRAAVSAAVSG